MQETIDGPEAIGGEGQASSYGMIHEILFRHRMNNTGQSFDLYFPPILNILAEPTFIFKGDRSADESVDLMGISVKIMKGDLLDQSCSAIVCPSNKNAAMTGICLPQSTNVHLILHI